MALPGQASGDFTESSSALRILYAGTRNTMGAQLTTDAFTQTNPPAVVDTDTISGTLPTAAKRGVLSGSVCFTRPDAGNGMVGGPADAGAGIVPLGVFINDAAGNAYENTPGPASGQGPYMSGQGTYGNRLYETQSLAAGGAALDYAVGDSLYASLNGYLTNVADPDNTVGGGAAVVIGVVKITPDSVHAEMVYDQRI